MNYREAILNMHQKHGLEIFENRFLARSILSDLVGSDIYSKRLIGILYDLSGDFNIALLFINKGLKSGREELQKIYPKYKTDISKNEFVDVINPISEAILPNEFVSSIKNKITSSSTVVINKVNRKKKETVNESIKIIDKTPIIKPRKQNTINNIVSSISPSLLIEVKAKSININLWKYDKVDVFIGKQGKVKDLNGLYINKDSITIKYDNPKEDISVYLPNKKYKSVEIIGCNTNITQTINNNQFITSNKTKVKTVNGSIEVNVKGREIDLETVNGSILFGSHISKAKVKTVNGNINCILHEKGLKKVSLNMSTVSGDINGVFLDNGLINKVGGFLHRPKNVNTDNYAGATLVELDLNTINGHIKFR